ncbi:glycosyl transferase [Paenibacillus hamazuiensis]|uniref:glycosyl transferase n=1 Tax=Paenibacillus hamazuiensis TaxID=2936508 RepID=UPI00200CB9EF|nr:glycosyl transferase [Paenibacillus hamazuiensis]
MSGQAYKGARRNFSVVLQARGGSASEVRKENRCCPVVPEVLDERENTGVHEEPQVLTAIPAVRGEKERRQEQLDTPALWNSRTAWSGDTGSGGGTAPSFRHLRRMTDDTGLLEHSLGSIPRRREGYTTDDNARALWLCLEWLELAPEIAEKEGLQELADTYLAFLLWAQREDGSFHNNFRYDRTPEEEEHSDDCLGRAVWALALTHLAYPGGAGQRGLAAEAMLGKALRIVRGMRSPRGWAYALSACSRLYLSGGQVPFQLITDLESRLLSLYRTYADRSWRWFEPIMSYGNGLLPWSLFHAYDVTGNRDTLVAAEESLAFLIERMTAPQGWLRPVGNDGWCTREACSQWDQQPLDVMKLALAAAEGYRLLRRSVYRDAVEACRAWFYGRNDAGVPLADPGEGACCDGLTPSGPNRNQGAESTLSFLLTEAICVRVRKYETRED